MPKRSAAATKNTSNKKIKQEDLSEKTILAFAVFQNISDQINDWRNENINEAEDLVMRIKSYVNIQLNSLPSKIADMPISFYE